MSSTNQTPAQQRLSDLKVSGYLMTLQTGVFCVFSTPGQQQPSAAGLPGVRISQSPAGNAGNVEIVTFDSEGWLRTVNGAALVRVHQGPAQVLVTIYQEVDSQHEAPRLQVVQLSAQADAAVALPVAGAPAGVAAAGAPQAEQKASPGTNKDQPPAEIGAHIQRRGDVAVPMGEWMGSPGSRAWIEGFGIAPASVISVADIEYQAVLGKGWLSPWVEGGQYCGSRGMALPILGLCVRLKGQAAKKFECRITATFTDGTEIGPVSGETPVEAESLAPLEAFFIEIVPRGAAGKKAKTLKAPPKPEKAEASAELEALLDEDDDSDLFEADDFDLFIEEDSADEPDEDKEPRAGSGSSRRTAASSKKGKAEEAAPPTKAAAGKSRASARGRKSGSRR